MSDEPRYLVFFESGQRQILKLSDIQQLSTDPSSWWNFLGMIMTGRPALMSCHHIGSDKVSRIKVAKPGSVPDEATFLTLP